MNKVYVSNTLLILSILIIPLLAAFVFKRKANKLREQKPVQFIIYSSLVLFSPIITIMLQVYLSRLSDIRVPDYHPLFLFIAVLAVIFVIRFLIIKEEWLQMKQMRKKNKELAKIYSIFTTGLILALMYSTIFANGPNIQIYIIGFLIVAFWIYFVYIALIISKKQKNMEIQNV